MKHARWVVLGCVAMVGGGVACGDGPVATAPASGGAGGTAAAGGSAGSGLSSGGGGGVPAGAGVGDDCSATSPCRPGLACAENVCEPGGTLSQGDACVIGPECQDGLQCVGGACDPAGTSDVGEGCTTDANCLSGLRCEVVGLGGSCSPAGTGDVGEACTSNLDCYGGLSCAEGECTPGSTGFPGGTLWPGVECEEPAAEGEEVKAYFEVPGAEDADEGDFFRLPFPNDVRRRDGAVDLEGFPTPGPGLVGVDLVQRYVDAIEASESGFGAYETVFFRFSGMVDIETLRAEGSVSWIDITAGTPEYNSTPGYSWYYAAGRTPYVCDNWLGVRAPLGGVAKPGHTYAVWLTTQVEAEGGGAVARPQNLVSLLSDSVPGDAALEGAHDSYAPFRDYLEEQLIDPATILNAAVFTVAPVQDPMAEVAAKVEALDAPSARDWVKCDDGVASPCDDGGEGRGCVADPTEYDEYHARVSLPIFQEGTPPYLTEGGGIVIESTPEREDVCLSLTVPAGTMPSEGWPVVVFAHGTGGSFRSHVRDEVAGVLAEASPAFAVLGIDQVVHGPRRGDSTESPENLFFNFQNPAASRGNPIQGAADQLSLAQFAAALELSASESGGDAIQLDPAQVFFFGHSQGSTEGSLALPFSDIYKAAVLSGNGGSLMDALVTKTKPVNITEALPFALSDPSVTETKQLHPVLSLLQHWIDPADPIHFALSVTREPIGSHPAKHLFQTFGLEDSYSPHLTMQTYAVAGNIPHVGEVLEDLELLPEDAPASGNVDVAGTLYTLGLRQYAPEDEDGHFVVYDVPEANADMVRFFETAASGTPVIGE